MIRELSAAAIEGVIIGMVIAEIFVIALLFGRMI
jgi:tetrahydromethanopterin S-methyltransferase subunit F